MKLMLYSHVVFVQRITYSVKRKVMVLTSYVIVVVLSDYNLFQTIIYLHKVLMVYKRVQFICPISIWIIYISSIYYHNNFVFQSIVSISKTGIVMVIDRTNVNDPTTREGYWHINWTCLYHRDLTSEILCKIYAFLTSCTQ